MNNNEIEEIYIKYYPMMYRCILKWCNLNHADTEDIIQHTFLKMIETIDEIKKDIKSWLFIVARNRFLEIVRNNNRRPTIISIFNYRNYLTINNNRIIINHDIILNKLSKALNKLTEKQKNMIYLKYISEYKTKEITLKTGYKRDAIYQLIYRGIEKIKSEIKETKCINQ